MFVIYPLLLSPGSKSTSDQNKINSTRGWIKTATYVIPDPISFHLASLSSCLLQTALIPPGILYLHIFIYLLSHSSYSLNNPFHSPLSPSLPTALSTNNLKFVCHCGDTEVRCPFDYPTHPHPTWYITPLTEFDQKPIESRQIFVFPPRLFDLTHCCQSRLCCCLPEPCHSSLPCNLVSRFTVLQLLMTKRVPGSPSGAFSAGLVKVIQEYKAGICHSNGLYWMSLK